MPTSAIALGQLSRMAFADEVGAFGVAATTGFRYAHYYSAALRETFAIEDDPVIGAGFQNFRDATPPAPALSEHGGQIVVPLCLNQIGDWLRLIFGAPTTTGSVNFTHVFSSGALTLPTRTIELNPAASDFRQHVGCAAAGFRIDFGDAPGFQRMAIDLLGWGENLLSTTAAGTVLAARTPALLKATQGAVLLGGTQIGVLLGGSLSYGLGAVQDRYTDGTNKIGAIVLAGDSTLTGELRVRYTSQTFDAAAVAETDQSLELRFVTGVNNSISFLAPAARLARAGISIDGPGGIEQTISFRCAQTAGAAMLGVTLRNQIATY